MRKNIYFAAIRTYFGRKQWRSICSRDISYAVDSICRNSADYGLTSLQSLALDNAIYGLNYGLNTGRMPTDQVIYWNRLGSQRRVELICEMAEMCGTQPVGEIYAAWRDLLAKLAQEKAQGEAETTRAMSACFAGEMTTAPV